MVFIVSSMLSGACATPEFLMYMNYFIEQEYGEDYYKRADEVVDLSKKHRTIDKMITDCFEQIVYSINQPTGARSANSYSPTGRSRTGNRCRGCKSVS